MLINETEIIVFYSKDNVLSEKRAKLLANGLAKHGYTAHTINKLSSVLDDLALVVKHRVVQTPTVLVTTNSTARLRILRIPTTKEMLALLESIR